MHSAIQLRCFFPVTIYIERGSMVYIYIYIIEPFVVKAGGETIEAIATVTEQPRVC